MTRDKRAGNCAWAIPTIRADAPAWLEADDRAWTCRRSSPPRPLETTDVCADCVFWQARPTVADTADAEWTDRVRQPMLVDLIAHR